MSKSGIYTVIKPLNKHGTVVLRGKCQNETLYVVECADKNIKDALEDIEVSADIELKLERVGRRGNSWRAIKVSHPDTQNQNRPERPKLQK